MIFGDRKEIKPHEAHEYFWDLFELNVVPMITWNQEGAILNCNQAFLDLLGYTKEDFENRVVTWKMLTPPECFPYDQKCIEELKTQHIATAYEKAYICKDGKVIKVRVHNASDHFSESGRGVAIIVPL